MRTPDETLESLALRALGDQCQIPAEVEARILAAMGLPGLEDEAIDDRHAPADRHARDDSDPRPDRHAPQDHAGPVHQPSSGVFAARGDRAAKRALAALGEQCEIPPELSDRLLDSLLAPPGPVVARPPSTDDRVFSRTPSSDAPVVRLAPSEHGPLLGFVRRERKDRLRNKRIGVIASLGAALLTALVLALGGPRQTPPLDARAPVDVRATPVSPEDPIVDEVRWVVIGMLREVARDCHLDVSSGVVWFEKTGYVSVLDFSGKRACEPGCVDRVAARFRLAPHDKSILVRLSVSDVAKEGSPGRDDGSRAPGVSSMAVRLTTWWVDES